MEIKLMINEVKNTFNITPAVQRKFGSAKKKFNFNVT